MSDQSTTPGPNQDPNVFSIEDIDKIIESADPEFKNKIDALKSESMGDESLEALNIESDDGELGKDDEDKKEEDDKSFRRRALNLLRKPLRKIKTFVQMRWMNAKNRAILFTVSFKNFFRHELPERIRYMKSRILAFFAWIKSQWLQFKALSGKQKIALISILAASWLALYFFAKSFSNDFLPRFVDDLPRSFADKADFRGDYQGVNELQELFTAFPEVEYHVLLDKVVVNLKPDAQSGPQPMGAFQFYIGVDSQDTAVEVKQREKELLDLVQRTLEGFTYTEAMSQVGKIRVKSAIRDRISEVLNQGRVMNVYLNMMVTYH